MPIRVSNLRLPVEEPEASLPGPPGPRASGSRPADLGRLADRPQGARHPRQAATPVRLQLRGRPARRRAAAVAAGPPARGAGRAVRRAAVRHAGARGRAAPRPAGRGRVRAGRAGVRVLPGAARLPADRARTRHEGQRPHPRREARSTTAAEFHPESNYLFGEGGAGTFSDGKLTCRGTGPDVLRVLELFAECKGQQPGRPNILYYHRPHLGSNRLPGRGEGDPPARSRSSAARSASSPASRTC